MTRHHIIQISDLHLGKLKQYNQAGWEACLSHINQAKPELVTITGDLVWDNPDSEEDHQYVRAQFDRLSSKWVALPGNHDIGDTNPEAYEGQHFDEERLSRYKRHFGDDHWSVEVGEWRLLGINGFLPGSGLSLELDQEEWLRSEIASAGGRPIGLFTHKPLCVDRFDEPSIPDFCVIASGRDRIYSIIKDTSVRFVANGHCHHYRTLMVGNLPMIWAPSTSQVFMMDRPYKGLDTPGLVNFWLDDDGHFENGLTIPGRMVVHHTNDMVRRFGRMRNLPDFAWNGELTAPEELVLGNVLADA